MLEMEVQMAVYFTEETDELLQIYESVRTAANTDAAKSAAAGKWIRTRTISKSN